MYNKITPNRIVARPRTLQDCVQNFHSGIEEITFVPLAGNIKMKSYVEEGISAGRPGAGEVNSLAVLSTEIVVDAADFEHYTIKPNTGELTFSLKELKAILQFCEAAGQPVSIYFSDPGQPILWSVNCYDSLTADFVLATASSPADFSQSSAQTTPSQNTPSSSSTSRPSKTQYTRGMSPPPRHKRDQEEEEEDDGGLRKMDDDDEDDYVEGTPERELKKGRLSSD